MSGSFPDAEIDLYIVGVGIGGRARMTHEAAEILQGALRVAHLTPFTTEQWQLLAPRAQTESLESAYQAESLWDAYMEMTERCFNAANEARSAGGYACFAVYGHPSWFVSSTPMLLNSSSERGVRSSVIPGISSLDTILIDAPVDLGAGVCILDIFQYLEQEPKINQDIPLVLMHFGEFSAKQGNISRLAQTLQRTYSASHRVHIVRSEIVSGQGGIHVSATLKDFASLLDTHPKGSSLVVEAKRVEDE